MYRPRGLTKSLFLFLFSNLFGFNCILLIYLSLILQALKSVLLLGLSPSSKTVESLENEILWNLRRSTVSQHFSVLHVYNEIKGTTMHKKIVAEIVSNIERRWVEIIEVKDVVSLLKYATYFNPKFIFDF